MRSNSIFGGMLMFFCMILVVVSFNEFSKAVQKWQVYKERVDQGYTVYLDGEEIDPPENINDYKVEYNEGNKEIRLTYIQPVERDTTIIPVMMPSIK